MGTEDSKTGSVFVYCNVVFERPHILLYAIRSKENSKKHGKHHFVECIVDARFHLIERSLKTSRVHSSYPRAGTRFLESSH